MNHRAKTILLFALIFTILFSLAFLMVDRVAVQGLGSRFYIIAFALIGSVLLILSGYVWDRTTVSHLRFLRQKAETAKSEELIDTAQEPIDFTFEGQNEILGIARKIEEMAQSLQKVDARYRAIVEDQTDLVSRYLPDGKLTFVNNAYCTLISEKREEIVGRTFFPFIGAENAEILDTITHLTPDNPITSFEHKMSLPGGETKWYQWTNRAIFDTYGRLFEHQAVGRDISEVKNLEAQVRQSQKLESVGQLAAGIAHDFNNILTVIQGHANLLMKTDRPAERMKHSAEQICLATDHASNLSRQLLVFSNKQVTHATALDLNEIIQRLTRMLGRILNEDISLELDCAQKLPLIEADSGMMEQIVFNLAVNARDAMPEGGTLSIRTSTEVVGRQESKRHPEASPGRFVLLSITDTGTGISPDDLPKIFEPFFSTKGVGKGSGLGLATVYGIVKQHDGWIEVSSAPGAGTEFNIYLPAVETRTRERVSEPSDAHLNSIGNETILLAEDEPVLRELVKGILEDHGYVVLDAESGVVALEVWSEHKDRIDLLLTDIVMPDGITGKDLAQRLHEESPDLKVVYTSGYSAGVVGKELTLKEGINFLQKPFEPAKLARLIRQRLDEPVEARV